MIFFFFLGGGIILPILIDLRLSILYSPGKENKTEGTGNGISRGGGQTGHNNKQNSNNPWENDYVGHNG